jgi:hypothetical protein
MVKKNARKNFLIFFNYSETPFSKIIPKRYLLKIILIAPYLKAKKEAIF